MRKIIPIVVRVAISSTVLLVAAGSRVSAQANPAAVAVDRAAGAWRAVHTARGTFEQTITNSIVGKTSTAHGEFQQQKPNKLSIKFTDQLGDAIVADGKYVWVYTPSSTPGQVLRRAASDQNYTAVDLDQFLDSPQTRFDITDKGKDKINGRPAHVVALVPKAGTSSTFSRATVWIDDVDALVHQIEVVEGAGVTRRIHLITLTVNVPVDASAFVFTPPKGVKIVGGQ